MTAREIGANANLSQSGLSLITDEMSPSACLDALEAQALYEDAVRFLAHKLDARPGIEWAVKCARELEAPERKQRANEPLEAAETWLVAPTDATRQTARQAADRSPEKSASTLIAMAVFFSGGSITPSGQPEVQPPTYSAAKMVAGAVRVSVVSYDPPHAAERYRRALALGRQFDGGLPTEPKVTR
jgi:hypothetical protein